MRNLITHISARALWACAALLLLIGVIIARLVYLQVIVADEYSAQAEAQRTSEIEVDAKRGTIYDRNGNVLATSIDATTIYVNPSQITDPDATAELLVEMLGGDYDTYYAAVTKTGVTFAYVYRKCDVDTAASLEALDEELTAEVEAGTASSNPLDGIYYLSDTKRVYPYGEIGGQIIGYVGTDGHGLSGLELEYDDILSGTDGDIVIEEGKGSIAVPNGIVSETDAVDGQDIVVSIDINLQEALEEALTEEAESSGASTAYGAVIDGATGEIYACASLPLYDLSDVSSSASGASTCKAISDPYEPGSCFKVVSTAALLQAGLASLDETIEVPSSLTVYDKTIKDSFTHDADPEYWTLKQIVAKSSNIGISLFTERLGYSEFYNYITSYGFGSKTGVDFPGEASGILSDSSTWSPVQKDNISFGQGISVTTLQLDAFFAALINGGTYCQPHFLIAEPHSDADITYTSKELFSSTVASEAVEACEAVVSEGGSATDVTIEGYQTAGKTGTAQIADGSGGYKSDSYNYTFAGFLVNTNSELTCTITVSEPTESVTPAKDAWKTVMRAAIDLYQITNN
jgi:cell division protein FtsI (penicillin-binding protein 3)